LFNLIIALQLMEEREEEEEENVAKVIGVTASDGFLVH